MPSKGNVTLILEDYNVFRDPNKSLNKTNKIPKIVAEITKQKNAPRPHA